MGPPVDALTRFEALRNRFSTGPSESLYQVRGWSGPRSAVDGADIAMPRVQLLLVFGLAVILELVWLVVWGIGDGLRGGTDQSATPAFPEALVMALVVASAAYIAALITLDRGAARVRGVGWLVLSFALLFQLTLMLMPGVFSTDVFSYLAYAHLGGTYGLNPYIHAPMDLPVGQLLRYISPEWWELRSPYGPLWTTITTLPAPLLWPLSIAQQLFVFKLFSNAVQLVNLGLVWLLLRRAAPGELSQSSRITAFALFAWNPVVSWNYPATCTTTA